MFSRYKVSKYSPLSEYKELVKEFDLKDYHQLPADRRIAFLQAQREELLGGIWREAVNVLHAKRLQKDENEVLRNKGNNNITEHKHMVKQFAGGVDTVDTLIKELEAEG